MNRKFILFTVICILFLFSSMINAEKTFYTNLITDADCTDNNQWIRSGFDVGSASGYGLINAVSPYDSENGDEALIVNYSFTSRSFYLYRDIDISEYAGLVDLGVITVDASAYIFRPNTNYYYFDLFYRVSYFDENDQLIGTEQKPTFSGWRLYNVNSDILAGTRKIRVEVYGDGNGSMVCAAVDGVETQLQLNTDKAVPVIYNGDKDQIVNSKGSIEISGYVYDKNNDDVIISASIDGQEASDRVTGGNGPWTFSWDANIIANGSYSNIQVSADDNNDGGYTDIYTGNIIIDNIVPDLLTVTMSSNNTYTGRARGGDKIILDIISSEDILEPEIIISGQTASVTDTGDSDATTWQAEVTIEESDPQGSVGFSVIATDLAGNVTEPVIELTGGSPVIIDTDPPTVLDQQPEVDAMVDDSFTISFDEEILRGSGSVFIKHGKDGSVLEEITDFTITSSTVTFNLSTPLAYATDYYITIAEGTFTDLVGNPFAGYTNSTDWTFSTVIDFPDANLKQSLLGQKDINGEPLIDLNEDGEIGIVEAETLTNLTIHNANFSNLSGLEYFTNLTELVLSGEVGNQMIDISSLSSLSKLTKLVLDSNNISYISPLSTLTELRNLSLSDNQINDISPLSSLIKLTELRLDNNSINDINVLSNLINLERLYINNNQLNDLSPLINLSLSNLQLSNNPLYYAATNNAVHLDDILVASNNYQVWVPAGNISSITDSEGIVLDGGTIETTFNEENLAGAVIDIEIYPTTFVDSIPDISSFELINPPTGLSISAVEKTGVNSCRVQLAFDGTDFDSNIGDFAVNIKAAVLADWNRDLTFVDDMPTLIATDDPESIEVSYDGEILEGSESGEIIDVDITGGDFATELNINNWSIPGLPEGISIASVNRINDNKASLTLAGVLREDYDSDKSLRVECQQEEYIDSNNDGILLSLLSDNTFVLTADNDLESISASHDGEILEGAEEGELITLEINGGTFAAELNTANWTLIGLPGIGIAEVTRDSEDTRIARIRLSRSPITPDYDQDINLGITCTADEYLDSTVGGPPTFNSGVTLTAYYEAVVEISSIESIDTQGAIVNASVTADGFPSLTERGIEYKKVDEAEYTTIPAVTTGTGDYSIDLSGLEDAAEYIVRAYAVNTDGTAYSQTKSFTTSINFPDENLKAALINEGVDIDGDGEISVAEAEAIDILNLEASNISNLTGMESFLNLSDLTLDRNNISDISPISGLSKLSYLSLADNQISDTTPLTGLGSLKVLSLPLNRIEDISPLIALSNLEQLSLEINGITSIPDNIDNLTSLTALSLGYNKISDFSKLALLSNLTFLHLSKCNITDIGFLTGFDKLRGLVLSENPINDYYPLADLLSLELLIITHNRSDYKIRDIGFLSSLTNLNRVDLSYNEISDLSPLSGLTKMQNLSLSHNQISNVAPIKNIAPISGSNSLTLDIDNNPLEDIRPLSSMNIDALNLTSNPTYDSENTNAVHLSELDFSTTNDSYQVWVPAGYITASSGFNEEDLNSATIEMEVYPSTFYDKNLDKANFELIDTDDGSIYTDINLSIDSVEYIDENNSRIYLAFDGKDFDHNIDNLGIRIKAVELAEWEVERDLVFKDDIPTITAVDDQESISISAAREILEGEEDGEIITVSISGGDFVSEPDPANWSIVNTLDGLSGLPEGVSIGDIQWDSSDSRTASITLIGNAVVDYDQDLDLTVVCTADEYLDSSGDGELKAGNSFTLTAKTIPTVSLESITEVTATTAVINANLSFDGNLDILEQGIEYRISSDNGSGADFRRQASDSSAVGVYTVQLSGLIEGEQYDLRSYAINAEGTAYSDIRTGITDYINVDFITSTEDIDNTWMEPFEVSFTDLSEGNEDIASWYWDFGDGNSSEKQNPTHEYLKDGTYTVSLKVETVDGDRFVETKTDLIIVGDSSPTALYEHTGDYTEGNVVSFSAALSTAYDQPLSYTWDFGDDNSSTLEQPDHIFADNGIYQVSLTVTDVDGSTDTIVEEITITNIAPEIILNHNGPLDEGEELTVTVDTKDVVADMDTLIYSFDWDNDGEYEIEEKLENSAVHVFDQDGRYTVVVRVRDKDGGETIGSTVILVGDIAPTADFSSDIVSGNEPLTVHFTDQSSSYDKDFSGLFYSWDFNGDGVEDSTEANPTYTYQQDGIYTVSLEVTEADGDSAVEIKTGYITVNDLIPTADFGWNPDNPLEGSSVVFNDNSSSQVDSIVGWYWDFGEGGSSSAENPEHVFRDIGIYEVSLQITDSDGSTNTISREITINDLSPTVDSANISGDEGESLTLIAEGKGYEGDSLEYRFTDINSGQILKDWSTDNSYNRQMDSDYILELKIEIRDEDGGTEADDYSDHTMTWSNLPPIATDSRVTMEEDSQYIFKSADFNYQDSGTDDQFTRLMITELVSGGSLRIDGVELIENQELLLADIEASKLIYYPAENGNGTAYDSFHFKVHDGTEYSIDSYPMAIDVIAVNDAPVFSPIESQVTKEGQGLSFVLPVVDTDGDRLYYSAEDMPLKARLDSSTGEFSWRPYHNQAGEYQITFIVRDGQVNDALEDRQTVSFRVEESESPLIILENRDFYQGDELKSGDIITYQIKVINIGIVDTVETVLQGAVPANTVYRANSTSINGNQVDDNAGECPLLTGIKVGDKEGTSGYLTAGQEVLVEYQVVVGDLTAGSIIANQLKLTGEAVDTREAITVVSDDPDTTVKGDSTLTLVGDRATIYAVKQFLAENPGDLQPGDILTFLIQIWNPGNQPLTGVVLNDILTQYTNFLEGSLTISYNSAAANSSLAEGAEVLASMGGAGMEDAGAQASIRGAGMEYTGVQADQQSNGRLSTLSAQSILTMNDLVEATAASYQLTNKGLVVELGEIEPGGTGIITYQLEIADNVDTAQSPVISSQGTVHADGLPEVMTDSDGNPDNGMQTTDIVVGQFPNVGINMTTVDLNGGQAERGDIIEFNITMENSGSCPASNLLVSTNLPTGLKYLLNSTKINGQLITDQDGNSVLFNGYNFGDIMAGDSSGDGEKAVFSYQTIITEEAAINTILKSQAQYTAMALVEYTGKTADIELKGQSLLETGQVLVGGSSGKKSVTATISNPILSLEGWTAELYYDNQYMDSRSLDSQGQFTFNGLLPADDYSLLIRHPETDVCYREVKLPDEEINTVLDLSIQPTGIVYDSLSREAVADAVIKIFDNQDNPVGNKYLLPGQQGQITGEDGWYRFDPRFDEGLAAGEYRLEVLATGGYVSPSVIIEAEVGSCSPGTTLDTYQIVENSNIPAEGEETRYYLAFELGEGSAEITNNHIPLDLLLEDTLLLIKTVERSKAVVGDILSYNIRIENPKNLVIDSIRLIDIIPAGFKYLPGTARLNGEYLEPTGTGKNVVDAESGVESVGSNNLSWSNLSIEAHQELTLSYMLVVGTGVSNGGIYINKAYLEHQQSEMIISNTDQASVTIITDPLFSGTLIIGKVFIDKNSNGRQDEGEEGLAGVELLTLDGRIITTDQYGRYHLFGSLVDGSSFVIKLLEDSLPEDMILVSENPKLIKISEGLMSKLNWLVK